MYDRYSEDLDLLTYLSVSLVIVISHIIVHSSKFKTTNCTEYTRPFLVVMLALWSSSSTPVHFTFCFLSFCIILLYGAASGDKGEVSRR